MDEIRRNRGLAFYLCVLGSVAMFNLAASRHRHVGLPLFFGILHFGLGYTLARRGKRRQATARRKWSDQGRWLDAPIAEVDKSTCGLLLANRWRRDPSLRVIASQGGRDSTPGPHGGLWDRELDG